MSNSVPAYPDVDRALKRFQTYIQELPENKLSPQSPNAGVFVDMGEFNRVADALRQLPVCTAPQLVNPELTQQIKSLQNGYKQCLDLAEQKGIIRSSDKPALLRSVFPNVNAGQQADNYSNNSPQRATSAKQSSNASKGFFAFDKNTKAAAQSKQPASSGSIFNRVFGKRVPA